MCLYREAVYLYDFGCKEDHIYFFVIGIMHTAFTIEANYCLALRWPGDGRAGAYQ